MGIKKLNPVTPGTRFKVASTFEELTTDRPYKPLVVTLKKTGGRNNQGKRTMRMIGGGHKRNYRLIDFKRDKHGIECTVMTIEYDPNRSARIALVEYADGEKRYIISPAGLTVGMKLSSGTGSVPEMGNGGSMARSAGSYAQLSARDGEYAIITLPSGETRKILAKCIATIGTVSNGEHNLTRSGKAGRSRWLGRRPRVRGVAMNPVDHPMGGGEGRQSGGIPRSRKGTPAKGLKTRKSKKPSSKFIIERRKK
jgi:large subunit ribosomal protein L2